MRMVEDSVVEVMHHQFDHGDSSRLKFFAKLRSNHEFFLGDSDELKNTLKDEFEHYLLEGRVGQETVVCRVLVCVADHQRRQSCCLRQLERIDLFWLIEVERLQ